MHMRTIILGAALAIGGISSASAATIDQNFVTTDDPNHNTGLGIVTTSLAQSFTVGLTGLLNSVSFNILKIAAIGDLTVDIRNLSGGAPDTDAADALGSVTIANGDIDPFSGQPYAWSTITADFSTANIAVNAGDQFAFVLSSPIGEEFGVQTDYTNGYSVGNRFSQNGDTIPWGTSSTFDLAFQTTVDVAAVPLPAGIPLVLSGLGGFAFLRRLKTKS